MQELNKDILLRKRKYQDICNFYSKNKKDVSIHQNKIKVVNKIIKKYMIILNNNNSIKWPVRLNNNEKKKLMQNFHMETDYKKICRIVCCVCARFFISSSINTYQHSITYLYKYKSLLNKELLYDYNDNNNFKYPDQFELLDDMVLHKNGFNSNTVINIY